MGWKPTRTDAAGNDDQKAASPTPTPRRRRRRPSDTPNLDAATEAVPRPRGVVQPPGKMHGPDRQTLRVTLGDRWSRIVRDVKAGEYTWQEFVEELDDEELARCQLRASDGSFTGRPPSFVPREFVLACQRELRRKFEVIFSSDVLEIARQYVKLAQDENLPADKRAKMMQYAMERIFGGIPKEFKVSAEAPWEAMLVNVVSEPGQEMPDHLASRYAGYRQRAADPDAQS
jgi:hypothetical protein